MSLNGQLRVYVSYLGKLTLDPRFGLFDEAS
jgi:hypothetical protein